jgi:choline kinase
MYDNYKVTGPYYDDSTGRMRIELKSEEDRITMQYSKYLMEKHLKRYLMDHEVVHHKDENPLNNTLTNLEVLTRLEHQRLHLQKSDDFICPQCKREFTLCGAKRTASTKNRRQSKAGPFCNKSCAMQYIRKFHK